MGSGRPTAVPQRDPIEATGSKHVRPGCARLRDLGHSRGRCELRVRWTQPYDTCQQVYV